MSTFLTLDQLSVAGKRVLVRVDLNVPMQDGNVTDATRIERLVPTIRRLTGDGAKVILMSHFGRPKGGPDARYSLRQLVPPLSRALGGVPVQFAEDCVGPQAIAVVAALRDGDVALLENLRFHPEEEANDTAFARHLASLADIYVNDAFSVSHRAHASTAAVARLLPRAAGLLMQAELEALRRVLVEPARPLVAQVGGAKVSTKLDLLSSLSAKVDTLVILGAMANTLLLARGIEIGRSLAERDMIDTGREILAAAERASCRILLPSDAVVAAALEAGAHAATVPIAAVPADCMVLDIGPASVREIATVLDGSRTVIWNGPAGAFEIAPFDAGTVALAKEVAARVAAGRLVAVAGGGDTVAALAHAGVEDKLTYVSTAGGAFLEWLEGRELPGVKALEP